MLIFRTNSEVIPEKTEAHKTPPPPHQHKGTLVKGQLSRTDGLSGSPDGSASYWQPTGRAERIESLSTFLLPPTSVVFILQL